MAHQGRRKSSVSLCESSRQRTTGDADRVGPVVPHFSDLARCLT